MASEEVSNDLGGLYDAVTKWTLAQDASLFGYLEDFSKKITGRTECTSKLLQTTWEDCEKNRIRLQSCVNSFNMLSNVQFMESRVRDEDYETSKRANVKAVPVETPVEETPENKRVRELRQALSLTQNVLRDAFDVVEINVDDSDEEETIPTKRTFREPKDPYLRRPLPYLIGSADFHRDRFIGLKLQADEPQAVPEEDLILTNKLDDVLVAPNSERPRTQTQLTSSSTSSDIPQGSAENLGYPAENPPSSTKPFLPPIHRKATALISSDSEDENDLFATRSIIPAKGKAPTVTPSPTLDSYRTSPPRTRTSSQTSSRSSTIPNIPKQNSSIFDNDEEDEDSDLFSAPKSRSGTVKPTEPPKTTKPAVVARAKAAPPKVSSLFDDDDEDQDDLFSVRAKNKTATSKTKSPDDSVNSVSEQPVQKPVGPSAPLMSELAKKIGAAAPISKPAVVERKEAVVVAPPVAQPPKKSALFDDNSDEDDLFALPGKAAPKSAVRPGIDSPLAGRAASSLPEKILSGPQSIEPDSGSRQKLTGPTQSPIPRERVEEKAEGPLEQSKATVSVAVSNGPKKSKPSSAIFDDDDSDDQEDLFSAKPRPSQPSAPPSRPGVDASVAKKVTEPIQSINKVDFSAKKKVAAAIFDDEDDNDDLFAVKKSGVSTTTYSAVQAGDQPVTNKNAESDDASVAAKESEKSLKPVEKWKLPGLTLPLKKDAQILDTESTAEELLSEKKKKDLLFEDDQEQEDLFAKKAEPQKAPESVSESVSDKTPNLSSALADSQASRLRKDDVENEDVFKERSESRSDSVEFAEAQLEPPPQTAPPRMLTSPPKWKLPGLTDSTAPSRADLSSVNEASAVSTEKKLETKVIPAPAPRVRRSAPKSSVVEPEVTAITAPPVVDPAPRSLPPSRSSSFSMLPKPPTIPEEREENLAPPTPMKSNIIPEIPEMSLDAQQKVEPAKRPVPARRAPTANSTTTLITSDLPQFNDEFQERKMADVPLSRTVGPLDVTDPVPRQSVVSPPLQLNVRTVSPTKSTGFLPPLSLDREETDDFQDKFGSDTPLSLVDSSVSAVESEFRQRNFEPLQEVKSKGPVESRSRAGSVKPAQALFKTPSPDLNDEFDESQTAKKTSKTQEESQNTSPLATKKAPGVPVELGVFSKPTSTVAIPKLKKEASTTNSNPLTSDEKELEKTPTPVTFEKKSPVVLVEEEEKSAISPLKAAPPLVPLKAAPPLVVRIPVFSLPDSIEALSQVPEPPPLSFSSSLSSSQSSLKKQGASLFEDDDSDEDLFGASTKTKPTSGKTKEKVKIVTKPNLGSPSTGSPSTRKFAGVSQSGIFDLRRKSQVVDPLSLDPGTVDEDVTPKASTQPQNVNLDNSSRSSSVFDVAGSAGPRKTSIFENDEDKDDMFGPPLLPAAIVKPKSGISSKKKPALFDDEDDDDDDLFKN